MILALYFLLLAGFLLFLNIRTNPSLTKFVSYLGMWAAVGASVALVIMEAIR